MCIMSIIFMHINFKPGQDASLSLELSKLKSETRELANRRNIIKL